MPANLNYAAVDLGAESGRVMLARFDGERLLLDEVHRFANIPVRVAGTLHWDILRLWGDIQHGLGVAARQAGGPLQSIGVDTWGLDFALLARDGQLLGNPVHYRDGRTHGMVEEAFGRVPRAEIFEATGVQFMPINSLYQLLAMRRQGSSILDAADRMLTIPDLFNYWLSGEKANEFSNATTTQCYDPRARDWAWSLIERLNLPTRLFGRLVPPGTVLGPVRPALANELGLGEALVVAPATHDTGSAVAAESTETLRDKLAKFYAQRTLTKSPITLADQAEAAYLLISRRLAKTTGQILSVDGGLPEAFLR